MVGLGDVYLEKNKKGEVVLVIGIGNGKVSKKVVKDNADKLDIILELIDKDGGAK